MRVGVDDLIEIPYYLNLKQTIMTPATNLFRTLAIALLFIISSCTSPQLLFMVADGRAVEDGGGGKPGGSARSR